VTYLIREGLGVLDPECHGTLELPEYLQMMSAVKSGAVSHSSFIEMAKREHQEQKTNSDSTKYGEKMERSGGGL